MTRILSFLFVSFVFQSEVLRPVSREVDTIFLTKSLSFDPPPGLEYNR